MLSHYQILVIKNVSHGKRTDETLAIKGNVRVYIERMLMSARFYSIAHAYKSILEIHLQFVFIL